MFLHNEFVLCAYGVGVHSHKTCVQEMTLTYVLNSPFRIIFCFLPPFFSCSVLNDSECIHLRGRLILIHECLNILYPSTVQKGPVGDGFSFPLSDFIMHFLMPFYACSSLILSLCPLQSILRFSTPCA